MMLYNNDLISKMQVVNECNICCETITKSRYNVTSPCCGNSACKTCYLTFLLGNINLHCMFTHECSKQFNRSDIIRMFRNTDANKVINHNISLYMKIEFNYIAKEKDEILIEDTKLNLNKELFSLSNIFNRFNVNIDKKNKVQSFLKEYKYAMNIDFDKIKKKYYDGLNKVKELVYYLEDIETIYKYKYGALEEKEDEEKKKKTITINCPDSDCSGYTNIEWKCINCDKDICNKCGEFKDKYIDVDRNRHVCDNNIRESFKFMINTSKSCPSCKCYINKISGCSQMWCVNCNTSFDYNTGKVIKGYFHNPHYTEYVTSMKEKGIEIPDNIIGENCDGWVSISMVAKSRPLAKICELMLHYRQIYENKNREYNSELNKNARRKFIEQLIDYNTLFSSCKRNITLLNKNNDLYNIIYTALRVVNSLLQMYCDNKMSQKDTYQYCVNALTDANNTLNELVIDKIYGSVPEINIDKWLKNISI